MVEKDVPEGHAFFNFDGGGWWSDAEKMPGDDGKGNPEPFLEGEEDDMLCWAASACNMLEYTGWGFVEGMDTADDFLDYYEAHVSDHGSYISNALGWWGFGYLYTDDLLSEEDVEGGNFWTDPSLVNYLHFSEDMRRSLYTIETHLAAPRACGIEIDEVFGDGVHAITVWGINVDTSISDVNDPARYKGIWISDSDSHKTTLGAANHLTYYSVIYRTDCEDWYMPSYGATGGWSLLWVTGLDVFPGETRPRADAQIVHNEGEGSKVFFSAVNSHDDDGDELQYRWDLDGDGWWDTEWSSFSLATRTWDDDYVGTAYVQVFDGRLTDMDSVEVVVANVAPSVEISMDEMNIDENSMAIFYLDITEPGFYDNLAIRVDWGDGSDLVEYPLQLGILQVPIFHRYVDDDPTATLSDPYTMAVRVWDKDGGTTVNTLEFTIWTVSPVVDIESMTQPNPFFILPLMHELEFVATFSDIGIADSHTAVWDWGDGTSEPVNIACGDPHYLTAEHTFAEPGTFVVTLTVTDDDGAASYDTWNVEVASASEAVQTIDEYIMALPDSVFSKNPSIANERKNALHNMLLDIVEKLDAEEYFDAQQALLKSVKTKMDGLPVLRNSDWIRTPAEQETLCNMIDEIDQYLSLMI